MRDTFHVYIGITTNQADKNAGQSYGGYNLLWISNVQLNAVSIVFLSTSLFDKSLFIFATYTRH